MTNAIGNAARHHFPASQISRRVEIEAQALLNGSPIEVGTLRMAGREAGTILLYQRRLSGLATGIGDGVVLLHAGSEIPSDASIADQLMRATPFDLTTFRIVGGTAMGSTPERLFRRDGRMQSVTIRHDVQEALPLGSDYTEFLKTLGRGTRRNVENCRQQAKQRGVRFEWFADGSEANQTELKELCRNNMPTTLPTRRLNSVRRLIASQAHPYRADIRSADGQLISAAGGFIRDGVALMLYQFNHRAHRSFSPSLTLRSFIVEQLNSEGIRDLAFVGSCSGLLRHACERAPGTEILVTRNSLLSSIKLDLCRFAEPRSRIAYLSALEATSGVGNTPHNASGGTGADQQA